jgi:hypothetical protein
VYVIITRNCCFIGSRCKNQTDQEGERDELERDVLERDAMERVSLEREGVKGLFFCLA